MHGGGCDDKSGLGIVSYRLLDPQGTSHFEYHYHANFHSTIFSSTAALLTRQQTLVSPVLASFISAMSP